jgi:hypothetical protein
MFSCLASLHPKHLREFSRLFRNHKYERNDDGDILIASARISGVLETTAPDGLGATISHNIWTTQGFNAMLAVTLANGTQYSTWFMAPFSGNVTPVDTMTAATFSAAVTELTTQYSQATRVEFVESAPASKSTSNTASPAVFTSAVDNVNIWGVGLLSSSGKGATSGVLLSYSKYATVRNLPTTGDTLGVRYTLTLQN